MEENTPTYNLKAVIHETGLTPATLRAWERRYGLLKPERSPGGHRLYTRSEIEMLKWLVARQKEGLSISQAVNLWKNLENTDPGQLQPLPPQPGAFPPLPQAGAGRLDALRQQWIEACMAFNERLAEQVLAQAFAIAAPETVCTELLQKGIAEFGARWYRGEASVQQEHFASAQAMRRLGALFAGAPAPTRPGRLLAACPPGEQHEFTLLLISYILRLHGWEVIYLGANVPLARLDHTLQQTTPRLVISGSQTLPSAAALSEMAETTHLHGIPLAYGGGIFNQIPALTRRIAGHFLGHDLGEAPLAVERLLSRPPELPRPEPPSPEAAALLAEFSAKEAMILASIAAGHPAAGIDPLRLENAGLHLTRQIAAALTLGSLAFLDTSTGWLHSLLEDYDLSPTAVAQLFTAYRHSVQEHLGSRAAPLLDWLDTLDLSSTSQSPTHRAPAK